MTRRRIVLLLLISMPLAAQAERPKLTTAPRFEEDYRFLADPATRTDLFDPIKYLPLSPDGETYLSLGGELRQRSENFFTNPLFGLNGLDADHYLLHRALLHADLHVTRHFRSFVQIGHTRVWGKDGALAPIDESGVDLQQGFIEPMLPLGEDARLSLRAGRQEISLGSQRMVSVREGPNLRQSFDGVRGLYAGGGQSLSLFAVRPIALDQHDFDDGSDETQGFWGAYGVTPVGAGLSADLYYLGLDREEARFAEGVATERRHSLGTRLWGTRGALDYNFEFVYQFGRFGTGDLRAWTAASDTGYTFTNRAWTPRLGLRADIASGDDDRGDGDLGTFNPLFPRGSYFTENALIGPANFIDLHPYLTLKPHPALSVTAGADFLWRQSTGDAIYRQPNIPIARTAGHRSRYTGTQPYLLTTWQIDPHASLTLTYVHFAAGEAIRDAGGGDSDYVGGWVSYRF